MILFSQKKKKALLLSFSLLSGISSGLGSIGREVGGKLGEKGEVKEKNFPLDIYHKSGQNLAILSTIFRESRPFKIFEKAHYLSVEKVGSESDTVKLVKRMIVERLREKIKGEKLSGQFMYRWASEKLLLIIVRFCIDKITQAEWYYDWFSVKFS